MTTLLTPLPVSLAVLAAGHRAPAPRTLVDIFDATVARYGDAPALDDGREVLSYGALAEATAAVADRLAAAGIGPGDRVGVHLPSGTNGLYVAILGVLRAGAGYVPVDVDDPPTRADLVFGEAGVVAVVGADGLVIRRAPLPGAVRSAAAATIVTTTTTVVPGTRADHTSPQGALPAVLTVVDAVAGPGRVVFSGTVDTHPSPAEPTVLRRGRGTGPGPGDDAWIIFTSGSTGTPKGVAVSHRSAAAFVDAEARLFLPDAPLRPGDRVLAGLSVAFDASCEEMWLAWRHGACLVPAPRALVRSGVDLGPWLAQRGITVVSTVPTLAALWPDTTLDAVRLLILGGEACPPDLARRLARPGREVWNTYGPTEATVVACAAPLTAEGPVRIGLPLDGWDLAVVDEQGRPVGAGGTGELVIGGVGLARYLDPGRDAERYAPLPVLGWNRAYRSGDRVRHEPAGLVFLGRVDDQVKVGGRRIELGEIDAALTALPGVAAAAAAVRQAPGGNQLVVGYLVPEAGTTLDTRVLAARLAEVLPAGVAPRLVPVEELPTRTSGKVDRDALPWPVPAPANTLGTSDAAVAGELTGTAAWVAGQWAAVLGGQPAGPDEDFFAAGGSSLAAARLVVGLRTRFPLVTVAAVYEHPTVATLAAHLDAYAAASPCAPNGPGTAAAPDGQPETHATDAGTRAGRARPPGRGLLLLAATVPVQTVAALRWLAVLAAVDALAGIGPMTGEPTPATIAAIGVALALLWTPPGRIALTSATVRLLLAGLRPGTYRRGGHVHVRLTVAERLAEALGATNLSAASWMPLLGRLLGARVGRDVVLHTLPPLTGLARLGDECSVEPDVDLSGIVVDGDVVHVGKVSVGARARVGHRSTLAPGARVGRDAHVLAGSVVTGRVPAGQTWAGSPAAPVPEAVDEPSWPSSPPRRGRLWVAAYAVSATVIGGLPLAAAACGLVVLWLAVGREAAASRDPVAVAAMVAAALPVATLAAVTALAAATAVLVRLFGLGVREGDHAVRSRTGWQVWATVRLLDEARTWLFPLYASLLTPAWLRLLGARVGRHVEASTVLLLPRMTTVADGAFLADDTVVGAYELAGGWLRVAPSKVGKRAFVGNSGIVGPGRQVRKASLVAVLSAAPPRAKAGTSWLGSPPTLLRRTPTAADERRTYRPARRLVVARATVEALRVVPMVLSAALGLAVLAALQAIVLRAGWAVAAATGGLVLLTAGGVAATVTTMAKWALTGRTRAGEHPLWSSFVWRNELVGTFVEVLAAPWFARPALATPVFNLWLRTLGAGVGRRVWCESYWLPEPDLVRLGDGSAVNRGCVLQTHLFHDRVMCLDRVTLAAGAALGPHSVALPGSAVGEGTTVGSGSLVLRGDELPAGGRWAGNPVAPERRAVPGP